MLETIELSNSIQACVLACVVVAVYRNAKAIVMWRVKKSNNSDGNGDGDNNNNDNE